MSKGVVTHVIAASFVLAALFTTGQIKAVLLSIGMFALAGSLTNGLAIHMLFEKVPGLYGSGVVAARFEEFKRAIDALMMDQFFNEANLERYLAELVNDTASQGLDFSDVIEVTDLTPAFNGLVDTILNSSFGSMLTMVGGEAAITPLKEPFERKMKKALNEVAESTAFQDAVKAKLSHSPISHDLFKQIEHIVNTRLDELTPQMVKNIIQQMIRQHLGWLVVWGGVLGGLIGLLNSQMTL